MTKEDFLSLINQGENQQLEFENAADTLPKSVWETYSSFSNTNGGKIILGVHKQRKKFQPYGVKDATKVITEFWNQVNNKQVTIPELATFFNTTTRIIDRNIEKLKNLHRVRCVDGRKEGYWEVIE